MASGVQVSDQCHTDFLTVKKDKKYRYIVFQIKDDKVIDVELYGKRDDTYEMFTEYLMSLGPDDCRYILYDMEYRHQCQGTLDGTQKQKLFLMSWCPDTARIKKKMLYSSSFDALKKALVGVHKYIQATDAAEASKESVEEKLRSTDRS